MSAERLQQIRERCAGCAGAPVLWGTDKTYYSDVSHLLDQLDQAVKEKAELDADFGELQNAIRDRFIERGVPASLIDGAGSDAGPIEFTLAEVGQGIGYFEDQLDQAQRELEAWRKCAEKLANTLADIASYSRTVRTDRSRLRKLDGTTFALQTLDWCNGLWGEAKNGEQALSEYAALRGEK